VLNLGDLNMTINSLILSQASESQIAKEIRGNLPENAYTGVYVSSGKHNFFGQGEKDVRIITLCPSGNTADKIYNFVKHVFIAFPKNSKAFDNNLVQDHILGITQSKDSEFEIIKACNEQREIYIYVAKDLSDIFCRVQGGKNCVIL
jgi:hypothetical protein